MRKIEVTLGIGEPPRVTVDGTDLGALSAVRVLAQQDEIPAVQVEFRGEIAVELPDGATIGAIAGSDTTAILTDAVAQLDPASLEAAIVAELGGLDGANTTGEAVVAALAKWAAGYGGA